MSEYDMKKCSSFAALLTMQLNAFTNSYAVKYVDCSKKCCECPYELKSFLEKHGMDALNDSAKERYIALFDEFCITPKAKSGRGLSDNEKIDLLASHSDPYRTLFHKEEERIIFTDAFRRLQYKTQVMVNSASDDQRTRLLHSLEVQKIGRKIAIALKANVDLVETITIAHDIGHTPFGHAGEDAIRKFLEDRMAGSFSHALQGVKVIDFLSSHRVLDPMGFPGLGVSDYVLEGVLKHDTDSYSENLASAAYRLQYDCPELYKPVGVNADGYDDGKLYIGGIESQIACWADKIAYMNHDWEEFVAVGLLEIMLSRVNNIVIEISRIVTSSLDETDEDDISKAELDKLKSINKILESLKDAFYPEKKTEVLADNHKTEELLTNLVTVLEGSIELQAENPSLFTFLSNEQYTLLYDFFRITLSWIRITNIPVKDISGKMDVIYVFYKYLCDTTSQRTSPALIDLLVDGCQESSNPLQEKNVSREDVIKRCNDSLRKREDDLKSRVNSKLTIDYKRKLKQIVKESFAVKFGSSVTDDVNFILKFVNRQLINSTRVRFMTHTAQTIVTALMEFYYNNPHMLPLKYRTRLELEKNTTSIKDHISELLKSYYEDRICAALQEDASSGTDKTHFEELKKIISSVLSRNNSNGNWETDVFEPSDPKKVIDIIDSRIGFTVLAKDAITLRIIADYVSGMTDRMAEKKYNEIISSSTSWSEAYSERGIIEF